MDTLELLKSLREEVEDWRDALSGERPSLDEICADVDAHLALEAAEAPTGSNGLLLDTDGIVPVTRSGSATAPNSVTAACAISS